MREVPIPADATERDKILRAYQRKNATYSVFFYIFLALSVACFLATIVTVIVFEFNEKMHGTLCCILLGAFLGGGIATAQIDTRTMESKLVKGLRFCGETLDCDAYTGGFNLQIAFATGFLAGDSLPAAGEKS